MIVSFCILYLSTLGFLTLASFIWHCSQCGKDNNLIEETNTILLQKEGLPKLHKKNSIFFQQHLHSPFNIDHPCKVHNTGKNHTSMLDELP